MNETRNPELHTMEEPSDDLMDVSMGFGVFFGVLFLIGIIATIIQVMIR